MLREYITLGGATIAIIDAAGVSYVHNDHLATPQVMTDGAAAVVWDASYRPFGAASIAGLTANAQRFPGQTADAETGYYDNWHRTYDPSIGRYLQSDPIGLAAGFNTYAYAGGNPVMYADPTGQVLFYALLGMQGAVAAIEFGVTWYYATTTLLAIYERYQAGCDLRDLVGLWDLAALVPALRYVRMVGRLARAGRGAPALAMAGRGAPAVPTRATGTGTPLGGSGFASNRGGGGGFAGGGGASGGGGIDKPWKDIIEGTAQKTGTAGHQFRTYREAITMAKSGRYKSVYMNRAYSTATGVQTTPRRLPDVLGVGKNGRVDVIEVPSKTDMRQLDLLIDRNNAAMRQLPDNVRGDVWLRFIK